MCRLAKTAHREGAFQHPVWLSSRSTLFSCVSSPQLINQIENTLHARPGPISLTPPEQNVVGVTPALHEGMAQPWQDIQDCVEQGDIPRFVESVRQHIQAERGSALGSLSEDLQKHCFSEVACMNIIKQPDSPAEVVKTASCVSRPSSSGSLANTPH